MDDFALQGWEVDRMFLDHIGEDFTTKDGWKLSLIGDMHYEDCELALWFVSVKM